MTFTDSDVAPIPYVTAGSDPVPMQQIGIGASLIVTKSATVATGIYY